MLRTRLTPVGDIAAFDFVKHDIDIGGGKTVLRSIRDRLQLGVHRSMMAETILPQRLTDPFGHGHTVFSRRTLDVPVFVVVKKHLQSFSHVQ